MEFISGISKKEYASIKELAQGSCDGKTVQMEEWSGAVRDMGDAIRFSVIFTERQRDSFSVSMRKKQQALS